MFWGFLILIALLLAARADGGILNFCLIFSAGLIAGAAGTLAICAWVLFPDE